MSRPRLGALDSLRALAAFAVVAIHTTAGLLVALPRESASFLATSLLNQWARFSIPAFVLISGIVLAYGYGSAAEFHAGTYLWKRLKAILPAYVTWSVVYILFEANLAQDWQNLLSRIATALFAGTAMYQLYFIVLILQFYLLFLLARPLLQRPWFPWIVLGALLVQLVLMADAYYGWVHPTGPVLTWAYAWRGRLFPWWIGFFALGLWLGRRTELLDSIRRWRWPLTGATILLLGGMMLEYLGALKDPAFNISLATSGFRPTAYLYAIVALVAILGWGSQLVAGEGWLRRLLDAIGRDSFGIYLIHPLLLWELERLLMPMHLHPIAYLGIITTALFALSWGATWLVKRIPGGRLVMSN